MFKYVFIANIPGVTPDTYTASYENEESTTLVIGVSSPEMADRLVKKYDREGYDLMDFCGDFDDEDLERFSEYITGDMRITHADYFPQELAKLDALPSMKEYGIIAITRGVETTQPLLLESRACNTHVRLIKDLDGAKAAAKELVEEGINFIELCSWFHKGKTEAIIRAIDAKVPVGSCGEIL